MPYPLPDWVNDSPPALNAENLNAIVDAIRSLDARVATLETNGGAPPTQTRYNRVPNPACGVNLDGWRGAGSRARVTNLAAPWPRTTGARVNTTAQPWGASLGSAPATGTDVTPGQRWSGVGWVMATVNRRVRVNLVCWAGGGFVLGTSTPADLDLVANVPAMVRVSGMLPAGSYNEVNYHVDLPTAGQPGQLYVSAVRLEPVDDPSIEYRDGDSEGWVWDGPAHASTSRLASV